MNTPDTQVVESETLEQIASEIMRPAIGKVAPAIYRGMVKDVADALRKRDQRAARIIKEHRESDICRDNCWTTITNQILGKDGNSDAE